MKSTASRSPFQSSAIAVALASSLFALTACGGGGSDSSTTSGPAGSTAGGATAVASNAQGSTAAGNSATNGSTQQGPGAAVSGTQPAPGAAGSATPQGQGTAGSTLEQGLFKHGQLGSMGPGNGSSNSESQAALWRGKGIGTEYARRIHATCPTLDVATEWGSKAYVPSILSCVAGSYAGTDLWTGQRCEVNIAANGDVRASNGGRPFRPFNASRFGDYSWRDGAFRISLEAQGRSSRTRWTKRLRQFSSTLTRQMRWRCASSIVMGGRCWWGSRTSMDVASPSSVHGRSGLMIRNGRGSFRRWVITSWLECCTTPGKKCRGMT